MSSARVALLLRQRGILRVRPLLGGIDAWRQRNYPTDPHVLGAASLATSLANEESKPQG